MRDGGAGQRGRGSALLGLIPAALAGDRFGPLAAGDGGDPIGHGHQRVPGLAASVDDRGVVRPDPQAELVLPQIVPEILDRVEFWAIARQRQQGEVARDLAQRGEAVPAGAIQHQDGMGVGRDLAADRLQMQAHRLGVGKRQHQPGADRPFGADRPE
jgi:hypothetical protein